MGTIGYEGHTLMDCRTQTQCIYSGQTRGSKEEILLRRKEPSHKQRCGRMAKSRNHQARPISYMDLKPSASKEAERQLENVHRLQKP